MLQGQKLSYVIDETSVNYVKEHGGVNALFLVNAFNTHSPNQFDSERAWKECLSNLGVCKDSEVRVASEGAFLAGLLAQGVPKSLGILSDDAGQFNVLEHALCWIHEERHLKAIVPLTAQNREETELVLNRFWHLYQELKSYQKNPSESQKKAIEDEFDALFKTKTMCDVFNRALSLIYDKKAELLKVLARPEMPLHNNGSEQEIREYVTRRKLSGGTRSDAGKQCRDTFTSLKKTCHKLSVSFWEYLRGRLGAITSTVDYLLDLVKPRNFNLARTF